MARETWAVYSVKDHMRQYAFVADVLLYDRLLLPTPSSDDLDRWAANWDPARQNALAKALGDRCRTVEWDEKRRTGWESAYAVARTAAQETDADAFKYTRRQLMKDLPTDVTGIDAVAAYTSLADLRDDVGLTRMGLPEVSPGLVSAAFAAEFVVPAEIVTAPRGLDQELEVLGNAVKISSTKSYQRNRRSYWRMMKEFSSGVVTERDALIDAVEEMRDLVDEQNELVRECQVDTAVRIGFLATTVTLGFISGPALPVVAAGSALLAVGQFTWSELQARRHRPADEQTKVVAMFSQLDRSIRDEYFRIDQ